MKDLAKSIGQYAVSTTYGYLLEYDTPKYVRVNSKFAGLFFRLVQLCVLLFISLYLIMYSHGYQSVGNVASVTTYELIGVSLNDASDPSTSVTRLWDPVDYTIPPREKDVFIIPTRYVYTPNQMYGYCPENPIFSSCTSDKNCAANIPVLPEGNGIMNGTCDLATNSCVIFAWCPVEGMAGSRDLKIPDFLNFTVFIKNYIYFPTFPDSTPIYAHRNLEDDVSSGPNLKDCRYDPRNKSLLQCPNFSLRTLLTDPAIIADGVKMNIENLTNEGGVVEIGIHWDCNLDFSIANCNPKYQTRRLDRGDVTVSPGFNFRKADYSYDNNGTVKHRYLYKLFGIKFNIVVTGTGRKFNVFQLLRTLGSGLSYFVVASILTDLIILWIYKKRKLYRKEKYQTVYDAQGTAMQTSLVAPLLDN